MNCVLAIDIGGTKLAAALVDEAGSVLRSATRPTPRTEVMAALTALIAEVTVDGPPPLAVGIGCAGPLDLAEGTVSPVNMPSWRGFPLRDEVQALTGLPTVLAGDAQCFALGEHWLGAGQGSRALLGIVVSTGIGGGLVIDGAPILGPTGNAGHVGHMSVDPYGERCECGGRGCVERYASGPNMARWATENGWTPGRPTGTPTEKPGEPADEPTGEPAVAPVDTPAGGPTGQPPGGPTDTRTGRPVDTRAGGPTREPAGGAMDAASGGPTAEPADARALARDAAAGDPVALAAFERGTRALAGMIASVTAGVEVTTVVIGGGVSAAGKVLFGPLERALDDIAGLPFVRAVRIQPSTLGVRAGLAGAASLAWRHHTHSP
ncbi:ROK family protein [Nonomuraea pusilla]|uniref:Glucokinase n=1 Tax=Nonomuraea pusilla TaxID=46177 RepID=A0A1H7VF82_9ACTN|nr:ROK family protein [Nonomuraea pusilla]SEM07714.1 glucokinase [Nonomuraea pusilla]